MQAWSAGLCLRKWRNHKAANEAVNFENALAALALAGNATCALVGAAEAGWECGALPRDSTAADAVAGAAVGLLALARTQSQSTSWAGRRPPGEAALRTALTACCVLQGMAESDAAPLRRAAAAPEVVTAVMLGVRLAKAAVRTKQRFGHDLLEDICSVLAAAVATDGASRALIDNGQHWAEFNRWVRKATDRRCVEALLKVGEALCGHVSSQARPKQPDRAAAAAAVADAHMQELLVRH